MSAMRITLALSLLASISFKRLTWIYLIGFGQTHLYSSAERFFFFSSFQGTVAAQTLKPAQVALEGEFTVLV